MFLFIVMRHGRSKKILNMPRSQRDAVIRNLVISMLKCGKINTTLAKAKYFAPYMEKLITKAKVQSLANTRYLVAKLDKDSVSAIYEIAKKFADRKGGYTKITKTWQRYGDAAKTAMVEFVF